MRLHQGRCGDLIREGDIQSSSSIEDKMPAQNKGDGGWKKFMWNSDTREFLGRTGGSWGKNICRYLGKCKASLRRNVSLCVCVLVCFVLFFISPSVCFPPGPGAVWLSAVWSRRNLLDLTLQQTHDALQPRAVCAHITDLNEEK